MPLKPDAASRKDAGTMAQLQHRHFATIATIIADYTPPAVGDEFTRAMIRQSVARHFADSLRRTNPKFDRARFMRACGAED